MKRITLTDLFYGTVAERAANFAGLVEGSYFLQTVGGLFCVVDNAWQKIAPAVDEVLHLTGGEMSGPITSPSSSIQASQFLSDNFDRQLGDHVDDNHFDEVLATFPTGWEEQDAAGDVDVSMTIPSFFRAQSTSAETAFGYRKQLTTDFEVDVAADEWFSWTMGPILVQSKVTWSANLFYHFGIHGGDGGYQNAVYSRARLFYNATNVEWVAQGQYSDGVNSAVGASIPVGFPPAPLYVRIAVQNSTAQTMRVYVGQSPQPKSMFMIYEVDPVAPATLSTPWYRMGHSRGAGADAEIFLGAVVSQDGVD